MSEFYRPLSLNEICDPNGPEIPTNYFPDLRITPRDVGNFAAEGTLDFMKQRGPIMASAIVMSQPGIPEGTKPWLIPGVGAAVAVVAEVADELMYHTAESKSGTRVNFPELIGNAFFGAVAGSSLESAYEGTKDLTSGGGWDAGIDTFNALCGLVASSAFVLYTKHWFASMVRFRGRNSD